MSDILTGNLTCPECNSGFLTGRGRLNSDSQWEVDWTCKKCQHEFGTVEVEVDDNSLAARRLRKRRELR